MKYQFQFAGANVNRRSSQPRKRLRIALLVAAFVMAVLAYWQFLQHLTRGAHHVVSNVEPAAATAAVTATAATKASATTTAATADAAATTTTAKATTAATTEGVKSISTAASTAASTEVVPATKSATDTVMASSDQALPQTKTSTVTAPTVAVVPAKPVEASPVAKVTSISTESGTKAATGESVPTMRISSEPPPPANKPRIHSPEDRLMRAGMTAFDNVLDLAKKYPDSYGFRAQDAFKDATLGKPIPVYTVEESDRAKYKTGEPVKPLLKPTDTWVFPVQVEDHVCCMVQVHYTGRDYVPGSASKLLGAAWNAITQKWPESKGYHPCIVVNPEIPGYFFTVPELPMQNMTDIVKLTYFHPSLSPADVILASWR